MRKKCRALITMPPFLSSCKACIRLLSGRNCAGQLKEGVGLGLLRRGAGGGEEGGIGLDRFSQYRVFSSRVIRAAAGAAGGVDFGNSIGSPSKEMMQCNAGNLQTNSQIRRFLGCGDGDEGNVLSKTYEERRVIGYAPEQLFAVVEAVDMYEDFVPWCQRSRVLRRYENGSFDAELEIGFKFLVESYVSRIEMEKPKYIKTTASQSSLFDHLINIWEFNPGPIPGTCDLHFFVDFKFQSPLYRQVASMFFKDVVSRLVGSFDERCHKIYGPAKPVIEQTYGESSKR